jgi:solute:Na+ symporter, SSS family
VSAVIVLAYVTLGGLTSAIYNEVLQFFMIVFGFAPLVWVGLKQVGGWDGMTSKLATAATQRGLPEYAYTNVWQGMGSATTNSIGIEWFGMVMGLGFVLSFGYWCTDFLVVQRAMAADSMTAARRTPLIAAVPKMFFPFLVIVPGMIALAMGDNIIPAKLTAAGTPLLDTNGNVVLDYDLATPMMLVKLFPTGMLGPRPHGAHRLVHVGDGGQRDRVQHRVDLRHLPGAHQASRPATSTTCGWGAWPRWAASRSRWRRPTWPAPSTTSWSCCSSYSPS